MRSTIHRYEIEPYGSPISLKAVCNRTRLISEAWILPFLDFDLYASLRRRRQSCSTQSLSNLGSYVSNYSKLLCLMSQRIVCLDFIVSFRGTRRTSFPRDVSKRPSLLSPLMIPCGSNLACVCVKWVSKLYSKNWFRTLIGDYRINAIC